MMDLTQNRDTRALLSSRQGMTLVEMLIAMTCTLILMGLVAQVFGAFGDAVRGTSSALELDGKMRVVAWRLRQDLAGVTAPTIPPLRPEANVGYFEYIDGPMRDFVVDTNATVPGAALITSNSLAHLYGDCDDVLLFTTQSADAPFVGKLGVRTVQSDTAEVAWFLRPNGFIDQLERDPTKTYTLYRKQLIVDGSLSSQAATLPVTTQWAQFYENNDVSVRLTNGSFVPNTLADLTKRENRFLHRYGPRNSVGAINIRTGAGTEQGVNVSGGSNALWYPFLFPTANAAGLFHFQHQIPLDGLIFDSLSARNGEDVILTNVIAFDVRAYDPLACVRDGSVLGAGDLFPGDPGYDFILSAVPSGSFVQGAYVDLGYDTSASAATPSDIGQSQFLNAPAWSRFSTVGQVIHSGTPGDPKMSWCSVTTPPGSPFSLPRFPLFDTWSTHYESNRFDENGNGNFDEGIDGADNDLDGFIDEAAFDADRDGTVSGSPPDAAEQETAPPYPYPLRGIEVRIRCYDPASRQIRQTTLRHTFVPH